MKKLLYCTIFLLVVTAAVSARNVKRQPNERFRVAEVDINAVKDSALLLADDYAVALAEKPEMATTRLNLFRRFHARQTEAVRDSVCGYIFDFMAGYVEQGKNDRADAFRDCFLSVATDSDSRLGPLYAMQLAEACEKFDTIAVKENMALLDDYAGRLNLDYDVEIDAARGFLTFMRTKRPINEELMGVWVGEGICSEEYYYPSLSESFFTDIDGNKEKYKRLERAVHFLLITSSKIVTGTPDYKDFSRIGYTVPEDVEREGKYRKKKSYIFETLSPNSWLYKDDFYECFPQKIEYDENSRSAYALWSSENFSSFNPDYYAQLRQQAQHQVAEATGNLARSNVSWGRRVSGTLFVNGIYEIGNRIDSWLATSTAAYWVREATLQLNSPKSMTVWSYLQYSVAKSNSNKVKMWKNDEEGVRYYKWEPEDKVYFLSMSPLCAPVTLGEPSKAQKKIIKEEIKSAKEAYQKKFSKLRKTADYVAFCNWFNSEMLNKLKQKSDNYQP